jgi:NAD(P)H-nitrite reductase large subunit
MINYLKLISRRAEMEQNLNQDILDKLTKVCTCKGISRKVIMDAIANGASTLEAVQKATGASTGSCSGKYCAPKILDLLARKKTGE